jgi:hypothetical protein
MAALSDQQQLAEDQRVELYEEVIWIIDDGQHKEIKLDASASLKLLAFLQVHRERLNLQAREE